MEQQLTQAAQPAAGEQATPQATEPKKKKWWIWLTIALIIIGVGTGSYFLLFL